MIATLTLAALVANQSREVVGTFAFFGCNRVEAEDFNAGKLQNPSSANLPQLIQNLADIAKLKPDFAFFGGDEVLGYGDDDGRSLTSQLEAWVAVVGSAPKAQETAYVAISGNHELNRKTAAGKVPNPLADGIFSRIIESAGMVPHGIHAPDAALAKADRLITDQGKLNFSFERGPVHYVVVDTDSRQAIPDAKTGDTKVALVATLWLAADLSDAERNPSIKATVILGHRNLVEPASSHGDSPIDPDCAKAMVAAIAKSPKVRAYVCAHVHAFDFTPIPGTGAYQVVLGNGGSKLEDDWHPAAGRTFGFGYFRVYGNGDVGFVPCFRPAPEQYNSAVPSDVPAATPLLELMMPAPSRP
ncbi:MAG: metallophosphoesterase [Armatimonadetes bacterium]|nr:metallophosphoesterase [Armatimonadota bacterium]MBS1712199.1 metallophosphoesterase [Armatimonadota bacterium]MBX3107906.1 metallophosphoesterase [Fimbriimonadaceae bacterium]